MERQEERKGVIKSKKEWEHERKEEKKPTWGFHCCVDPSALPWPDDLHNNNKTCALVRELDSSIISSCRINDALT